ncbi:MAG: hypothetical protein KAJ40_07005 [Alphaproteobacteria bacterium]|nr:hypothetical protein [Alphaproteobacteria bacterium]
MKKAQKNNKEFIARLMAVQACYQMIHNQKPVELVIEEYLESGLITDEELEAESQAEELASIKILPHEGLFKKILLGLERRNSEIEEIVKANVSSSKEIEPLLFSILLCGAYELLEHIQTDSPIIVNDYLNVTHKFYSKSQVSFVNGILDSVSKSAQEG